MTFIYKSAKINSILIEISQDKYQRGYTVTACYCFDSCHCGYPFKETYYATLKDANRRFNYLKRKAAAGEL